MKKIVKIALLFLVIAFPFQVKGYCTTEDKIRYSTLAANITTSYDYTETNDSVNFSIIIHNVHKDLIIQDKNTGRRYSSKQNNLNNFTISNLKDGQNYVFDVYADNNDCSYRLYNTLYVTIPKYNKYYKDSVCEGASEYLYCQKWVEIGSLTHEEFVNLVNDYKNQGKEEIIVSDDEEKNWLYIISDFWAKYYLYIAGGIIILLTPIIIIKNKRDSFDF